MGGMAIMLAFSRSSFFEAVTQTGRSDSYFMKAIANFFHFIFLQTCAVILVLVVRAYPTSLALSGLGFFVMSYAILVALAIAAQLLHTARIFNATASATTSNTKNGDHGSV